LRRAFSTARHQIAEAVDHARREAWSPLSAECATNGENNETRRGHRRTYEITRPYLRHARIACPRNTVALKQDGEVIDHTLR
jgi:hypothetical protein